MNVSSNAASNQWRPDMAVNLAAIFYFRDCTGLFTWCPKILHLVSQLVYEKKSEKMKDETSWPCEWGFLAESTGQPIQPVISLISCLLCLLLDWSTFKCETLFLYVETSDFTIHEEQSGKLLIISLTCLCNTQKQWSKNITRTMPENASPSKRGSLKAFVTAHCEGSCVKLYGFNSWPLWIFSSNNLWDLFQTLFSQHLHFFNK